jgi:hypothetical protein
MKPLNCQQEKVTGGKEGSEGTQLASQPGRDRRWQSAHRWPTSAA